MMVSKTITPEKPIPYFMWVNYLSLMVDKETGVDRVVKREKASQCKNTFKQK